MIRLPFIYGLFVLFLSCSEDEIIHNETDISTAQTEIDKGDLLINEFSVNGEELNEYDEGADWIEIYNTTSKDLLLEYETWTVTDNPSKENKFTIPEVVIPANGYLILWCDGEDSFDEQIHTSFKLSSKGESIGLYQEGILMDEITFDSIGQEYQSMARENDGAENWKLCNKSTLASKN